MILKKIFITKTKDQRLYKVECPIIGLTGGIATGKSTVSDLFIKHGAAVICADKLVKKVYKQQTTIDFIKESFPQVIDQENINFKKLREIAFADTRNKEKLESFIYSTLPQVFREEYLALNSPSLLVYDVPLLFEKKMEDLFDLTICVCADREVQIERIIKRDNSTEELASKILDNQIPINKKRELSDFCTKNNSSLEKLVLEFEALLSLLMN